MLQSRLDELTAYMRESDSVLSLLDRQLEIMTTARKEATLEIVMYTKAIAALSPESTRSEVKVAKKEVAPKVDTQEAGKVIRADTISAAAEKMREYRANKKKEKTAFKPEA